MGAGITTGLMLGSGVAGAGAEWMQGEANGRIADFNADINRLQARDAISRGETSVAKLDQQVRGLKGTQRAGYAGQGVVVGDGASADVAASTDAMSEADKLTLRNNAAMEAWGFRVQALDNRFQGRVARAGGRNRALGTLLTTGSDVSAYGYRQGMWGQETPTARKPNMVA